MKTKISELTPDQIVCILAKICRPLRKWSPVNGADPAVAQSGSLSGIQSFSLDWETIGRLIVSYKIMLYPSIDPETGAIFHWVAVIEGLPQRRGTVHNDPILAVALAIIEQKHGGEIET
jgi:hypothetical protein